MGGRNTSVYSPFTPTYAIPLKPCGQRTISQLKRSVRMSKDAAGSARLSTQTKRRLTPKGAPLQPSRMDQTVDFRPVPKMMILH